MEEPQLVVVLVVVCRLGNHYRSLQNYPLMNHRGTSFRQVNPRERGSHQPFGLARHQVTELGRWHCCPNLPMGLRETSQNVYHPNPWLAASEAHVVSGNCPLAAWEAM